MPTSRSATVPAPSRTAEAAPVDSIVDLTQALVRAPSRAGQDDYDAVVAAMAGWLAAHSVPCERLTAANGRTVGLTGAVGSTISGPSYLVNATLDTAPFGDLAKWRFPPTSATLNDGWLYGRGAADSKSGAALFAHLAAAIAVQRPAPHGRLVYVFDLDEHTGGFAGIKQFVAGCPPHAMPAGAFIGYPGNERVVIGGRGFARARLAVHGKAAHSGSNAHPGINAVTRAARLVDALSAWRPATAIDTAFPVPPRLTVTRVVGGEDFSLVPDLCHVDVDLRLTPAFPVADARSELERIVGSALPTAADVPATTIAWKSESWPAYRIPEDAPIVQALLTASRQAFAHEVVATVAGPSNIGNYLAQFGIPAIAGFGATARNIHGSDEAIEVASIAPVWQAYVMALDALLR